MKLTDATAMLLAIVALCCNAALVYAVPAMVWHIAAGVALLGALCVAFGVLLVAWRVTT